MKTFRGLKNLNTQKTLLILEVCELEILLYKWVNYELKRICSGFSISGFLIWKKKCFTVWPLTQPLADLLGTCKVESFSLLR